MSDIKNIFENARKKSKNKNTTCPNCSSPIRSNDEYCSVCGYNLTSIDEDESTNFKSDANFSEESKSSKHKSVIKKNDNNISDDIDYSKKNDLNKTVKITDSFFEDEIHDEKKKEEKELIKAPKVTKEDLLNLYKNMEETNNDSIEVKEETIKASKRSETIEKKDIVNEDIKEEIDTEREDSFKTKTDNIVEGFSGIRGNLLKEFTFFEESEEIKPIEMDTILEDILEEDKPDGLSNVDEIIKDFKDKKNGIAKKEITNINEDVLNDIDEYVKNVEKKLKEEIVNPTYINSRKPEDIFEEEIYDYYEPKNIEVEEATYNRPVEIETKEKNKYNNNETIEEMFEAVDDLIENENILFDFNKKNDDVILLNKNEHIDEVKEDSQTPFVVDIENILDDIENNQFDDIGVKNEEGPLKDIEKFMSSDFSSNLQEDKIDEIKEKEFQDMAEVKNKEKPIENLLIMQEMEKIKSNILETESALKSLLNDKEKPCFNLELEEVEQHLDDSENGTKKENEVEEEIISEDELLNKYYDTDEETKVEERKAYIEYLKEIGIVEEKAETIEERKEETFEAKEKSELKQQVHIENKEVKKKKTKKIVMEFKIDKKRLNG